MQQNTNSESPQNIPFDTNRMREKLNSMQNLVATRSKQAIVNETKATFSKDIDNFYCDFTLTSADTLNIVITSQLDAQVYSLEMSKEEKKTHEELNFFQSIQEIYQYIQQNIGQNKQNNEEKAIKIDQNGKITLTVNSTIGKKQRQREIILYTIKIQEKREEHLQKVIKKISKTMIELKNQFSQLKKKQEIFKVENREYFQKLNSYGKKLPLKLDRKDPHYQKFKELDNKITKIQDNTTYFNLINQQPLEKTGITYFDVKIVNTAKRNIMIGIGSKFIKGIPNSYTHPDFIGFYIFGDGYIWQKNIQRQLSLKNYPIQNGITITTSVNMDMGYVHWEICGVRVGYAIIPLQLKAKLLFPVLIMINVNDVVLLT